ncbi:hypothetical protein EAO69_26105 [Streptomyces sp. me109]|nr:hypothetical protein EAO69_26105 [Streptomyces sp. me109]
MRVSLTAVVFACVLCAVTVHSPTDAAHRDRGPAVIVRGAVCKSLSDPRYDVSCGTTAFGDVRYRCASDHRGHCPRTTSVTLRNVGRTPVTVTSVSGKHEGDRRIAPAPELAPGGTVTLRPRQDERYLFDILVRSLRRGVGAVEVVALH